MKQEKVKRSINFALALRSKVQDVTYGADHKPVKVKIGIHIGNVTAGIIGYQYIIHSYIFFILKCKILINYSFI